MTTRPSAANDARTLAVEARRQARALLEDLLEERARADRRAGEAGRPDPVKSLTGLSAFDRAVRDTQEIAERIERLLAAADRPERPTAMIEVHPSTATVPAAATGDRLRLRGTSPAIVASV